LLPLVGGDGFEDEKDECEKRFVNGHCSW
jgi:hypothetical protein